MKKVKEKNRRKPSENRSNKTAPVFERIFLLDGRAINCQLKSEHKMVWQALEAANSVFDRIVSAPEIIESLTENEKLHLRKVYSKNLEAAVTSILELLAKRELVFIRNNGKQRYFGSQRSLNSASATVPEPPVSRRRSALEMVYKAVEFYNRPVRADDVIEFIEEQNNGDFFERKLIVRDLKSLSETGELQIIKGVRGDGGRNLYLPAEFDSENYLYDESLTWLDTVAGAFKNLWSEHMESAAIRDHPPSAVTTAEIRERLEISDFPHPRLNHPKSVTNAMKLLSETASPIVKRIKIKATGSVLWIPADLAEKEVSFFGAIGDNLNKLAIAVERAEGKLRRPVTAADVKKEIQTDARLIPDGNQSLGKLLSDVSKTRIAGSNGERRERVNALIKRVGKANGRTYYISENQDAGNAVNFIQFINRKTAWQTFSAVENMEAIEKCRLFPVKIGRMLLLRNEAVRVCRELYELIDETGSNSRREIKNLIFDTERVAESADKWLSKNDGHRLPEEAQTRAVGLTAEELLEIYRPLYPAAANIKDSNRFITLCKTQIKRIPNEKFIDRFKSKGVGASELLFDRTDALIYAGIKWGGRECRYQALTAKSELGLLRDDRFVLHELKSNNSETKTTAIACLAFLQTEAAKQNLRHIFESSTINRVLYSAIWAIAFLKDKKFLESIIRSGVFETDKRLARFAEAVINFEEEKIWFL